MGGSPEYVFVIRHGARLDAADKKWHLSSPTPYDSPLTYGGFIQARQAGNQIANILEQAKIEHELSHKGPASTRKRRRFKVVIHSSPFLRCVQTSIGIASGLAQTGPDSPYHPTDVFIPATGPNTQPGQFKSSILRLDSFLGEWLSPEYFEMITPPPGGALMMGSAKAELLRREDYSNLTAANYAPSTPSASLWSGSPGASPSISAMNSTTTSEKDGSVGASAMAAALSGQLINTIAQKKGYSIPRPNYAISSAGKIPDGFVAHARDECVVVDYQWDSMREPLSFGDGGQFGEEWTAMHKRFRRGFKKLVDWYSTAESPDEMVTHVADTTQNGTDIHPTSVEEDDVETVVILVSHGAGCNALIGAITHQPVLMDVGVASITMAVRKQDTSYQELLRRSQAEDPSAEPHVSPHELYEIRMSASTEHLRSTSSTPVSARSISHSDIFTPPGGTRGRTPSLSGNGPLIGSFVYSDPAIPNGNRSTSASAVLSTSIRRNSGSQRPSSRPPPAIKTGGAVPRSNSPVNANTSYGLWAPAPSSLRLMDELDEESDKEDFDALLPNFDQNRFKLTNSPPDDDATPVQAPMPPLATSAPEPPAFQRTFPTLRTDLPAPAVPTFASFPFPSVVTSTPSSDTPRNKPRGPVLAAPIKIRTNVEYGTPVEEVTRQLGDGLGGLWGLPLPPGEAERLRDLSLSKRRWTTTERA